MAHPNNALLGWAKHGLRTKFGDKTTFGLPSETFFPQIGEQPVEREREEKKKKKRRKKKGRPKRLGTLYVYMFWVVWNFLGCKDFLFGI